MRLYFQYLKMLLKAEMTYRTSFIMLSVGQFFVPFSVFLGFYMLFERFGTIKGYSFYEMALCYGVIHCSFSLAESIVRGFDMFASMIREAGFDRLMLRPRNLVLQVLGSRFEFSRIGRLLQSFVVLGLAIVGLQIDWSIWKISLLVLMIFSGLCIFSGIFILVSTMCFWTIQGTEVANIFTDGGREMGQFPLDIYKDLFRKFFTFIVPFGMANYYPLLVLFGKLEPKWYFVLSPLYGVLFLLPCVIIWYRGVRRYQSSGS